MDASSLVQLFNLSVPTVTTVIAFLIVTVIYRQSIGRSQTQHLKLLMCYFAAMFLDWSIVDIHQTSPSLFVYLNGILYANALLESTFFAHFLFIVTRIDGRERFSWWNYAFPAVLLAVWTVWSAFIPYDAKLDIIKTYGLNSDRYGAYILFLVSRLPVMLAYCTGYTLWGAFRLWSYRRNIARISFPADKQPPRFDWLVLLVGMDILSIFTNVLAVYLPEPQMEVMVVFTVIMYVFSLGVLCYNLMLGNYLLVPEIAARKEGVCELPTTSEEDGCEKGMNAVPSWSVNIDRRRFEEYVKRKKPYLNPEFKITELANELGTNRTYVSMFIKTTYGTNFNGYFNGLRLDEFDRLIAEAERDNYTKAQIAAEAGFGTYKSYMRAREQRNGLPK